MRLFIFLCILSFLSFAQSETQIIGKDRAVFFSFLDENPESPVPILRAEKMKLSEVPNLEEWLKSKFTHPEFYIIKNSENLSGEATHEFDFSTIILRESGADLRVVEKRLPFTKEAFLSCGVRIKNNFIIIADAPEGRVDFVHDGNEFDETTGTKYHLATITPSVPKPALYYIRSFTNGVTGTSAASFWARGSAQEYFTWVVKEVLNYYFYSVEAHELGHVLADMGHSSMSTRSILSVAVYQRRNLFSQTECERIKNHKLVKPIK